MQLWTPKRLRDGAVFGLSDIGEVKLEPLGLTASTSIVEAQSDTLNKSCE